MQLCNALLLLQEMLSINEYDLQYYTIIRTIHNTHFRYSDYINKRYMYHVLLLQIFIWNSSSQTFQHFQSVPGDGSHAAELFQVNNRLFLAVANFGDRHKNRYNATSSLWALEYKNANNSTGNSKEMCTDSGEDMTKVCTNTLDFDVSSSVHDGMIFRQAADIHTYGATDSEYFEFDGKHYIAFSEEGDLRKGEHSGFDSNIYLLEL